LSNTVQMLAAGGSIAAATTFLLLAIRWHRRSRPVEEAEGEGEQAGGRRRLFKLGAVLRPSEAEAVADLQNRLSRAGLYGRDAVDLYLTVRFSFIVGGLLLFLLMVQLVDGFIGSVLAFMTISSVAIIGPSTWLDWRTKRRQLEIGRNLPAMLDLLVTCLDAGLNLEQGLARVSSEANHGDDVLAAEIRTTLGEMRAGLSIDIAFRRLSARVGHKELQNLTALITQATALGANLGDALRVHAQTMRHHRIVFLEERAGKANAKLTLPLTICLLPSVMILLMGPAVLMILRSL
jgi:tight adherence protein C